MAKANNTGLCLFDQTIRKRERKKERGGAQMGRSVMVCKVTKEKSGSAEADLCCVSHKVKPTYIHL